MKKIGFILMHKKSDWNYFYESIFEEQNETKCTGFALCDLFMIKNENRLKK